MEVCRRSSRLLLLLGFALLATTLQGVQGEVESDGPSESECRPYIEKALKELEHGEVALSSETQDSGEDVPTVEITDDSSHQEGEGDDNETYDDQGQGPDSKESVEEGVEDKVVEQSVADEKVVEQKPEPQVRMTVIQKIMLGLSSFFQKTTDKSKEAAIEDKVSDKVDSKEESEKAGSEDDKSNETDTDDSRQADTESAEVQAAVDEESKEKGSEEKEDEGDKDNESAEGEETPEEVEKDEKESEEQIQAEKEDSLEQAESMEQAESQEQPDAEQQPESKEEQGENQEEQVESKEEQPESHEDEAEKDEAQSVEEESQVQEKADVQEQQKESTEEVEDHKEDESEEQQRVTETDDSVEDATSLDDLAQKEDQESSTEDREQSKETEPEVDTKSSAEQGQESVEEGKDDGQPSKGEESTEQQDDKDTASDEGDEQTLDEGTEGQSTEQEADNKSEEKQPAGDEKRIEIDEKIIEKRETIEGEHKGEQRASAAWYAKQAEMDTGSSEDDKSVEEGETAVEELSIMDEMPSELRSRDHVEQLLKLDEEHSETENILNKVAEITLKELKKLYENAIKPLEVLYKYRDLSNRHFGDAEIFSKPLILFMGPWSGGKSSIINYLTDSEYNETALRTGAEPSPAYFNILMYGEEPEVIDGTELAADFTFSGLQKFGQGLEERLKGVKLPSKLLEKVNIVEIPGILEVRKQVSRVFPFNDACQWFIDRADIIFLVYDPSKLDVGPETEAILDQLKGREHQTRIVLNKADQVKPEELLRVQGALIWNISPLMSSPQPPVMYTTSLWSRPYEPWAPVRLLQAQERAFLRDIRSAIEKRIENKIASARRFAVRVRNHAKMVDCYLTTYYNHKSVFGNRKQVADEIIEHPQDYHIYEGLSTLTNISRYDLPDPDVYRDFFKLNPLYEFQQLSATCTYFRGCPINRLDIAIAYDLPELVGTHKKLVENALGEAAKEPSSTSTPGS